MALLEFRLQLRPLVGLYARLVRRELGLWRRFEGLPSDAPDDRDLFTRSVIVAFGQAFAAGGNVRPEFALALDERLPPYQTRKYAWDPLWADAFSHARVLTEHVAGFSPLPEAQSIQILDDATAKAVQDDYQEMLRLRSEVRDFSPDGELGLLWRAEPPQSQRWSQSERPDRWVDSLTRLAEPVWSSNRLSGDSVTYLANFGLDRIESRPGLIDHWVTTVPDLVALASRPKAQIRELVDCCRVDP